MTNIIQPEIDEVWGQRIENDLKINSAHLQLGGRTWASTGHLLAGATAGLVTMAVSANARTYTFLALFSKQAHSCLFCLLQLSHYGVLFLIVKTTLQDRKPYGVERLGGECKHAMFYSENKVR